MTDERAKVRRELVAQLTVLAMKLRPEDGIAVLMSTLLGAIILQTQNRAESRELLEAVHQRMLLSLDKFEPPKLQHEEADHG